MFVCCFDIYASVCGCIKQPSVILNMHNSGNFKIANVYLWCCVWAFKFFFCYMPMPKHLALITDAKTTFWLNQMKRKYSLHISIQLLSYSKWKYGLLNSSSSSSSISGIVQLLILEWFSLFRINAQAHSHSHTCVRVCAKKGENNIVNKRYASVLSG